MNTLPDTELLNSEIDISFLNLLQNSILTHFEIKTEFTFLICCQTIIWVDLLVQKEIVSITS